MKANLEMEGPGRLGEGGTYGFYSYYYFFHRMICTQNGNNRNFCRLFISLEGHRYCLTHDIRTRAFIWLM